MFVRGWVAVLAATGVAAAAVSCGGAAADRNNSRLTVFAASSLTESFTELGRVFEASHPGTHTRFAFASSSDLALQIRQGAPADVFASADLTQMNVLERARLARDPVVFALNHLVVVVPQSNPAHIVSATDLARPNVKLVLAAPEVPAGHYARQAFAQLGIESEVEKNVVSNESDVKAVLAKVALGEADAGVTYVTDLTKDVRGQVTALPFPAMARVTARYPIALIRGTPHESVARSFIELVQSSKGRRILKSYGFRSP